jgi:hypothetical protein
MRKNKLYLSAPDSNNHQSNTASATDYASIFVSPLIAHGSSLFADGCTAVQEIQKIQKT